MNKWSIATLLALDVRELVSRKLSCERIHTSGILDSERLASLITLRDIDVILATQTLLPPQIRVISGGRRLPAEAYTTRAYTDPDTIYYVDSTKLFRCFRDGGTIVLRDMHRYVPALTRLSWDLSGELGYAVTVNGYLTPYGTQGLRPHFDHHDVLVIQVEGEKEWYSYATDAVLPLQNNTWRTVRDSVDVTILGEDPQPTGSYLLRPGDTLFVPRGSSHAARTHGSMSFHLTLALQDRTHYDVAAALLRHASAAPGIRRSIDYETPPRLDGLLVKDTVAALTEVADSLGEDELTWSLYKESHSELLEAPLPLTAQYQSLIDFSGQTRLVRRSELLYQLDSTGDRTTLRIRDKTFRFPASAMQFLDKLMAGHVVNGDATDETLPAEARRKVIHKLLSEGVLIPADDDTKHSTVAGPARKV